MIVRFAQEKDLENIFEAYKDYEGDNLKKLDAILNKGVVERNIRIMLENKSIIIAEIEGKVIGGMAGQFIPCLFTNDIMFCSMLFFVHHNKRKHTVPFIREIEKLLKGTRATRFVVATPATMDGKMDRFYSLLGFQPLEKHFYKVIGS